MLKSSKSLTLGNRKVINVMKLQDRLFEVSSNFSKSRSIKVSNTKDSFSSSESAAANYIALLLVKESLSHATIKLIDKDWSDTSKTTILDLDQFLVLV